jgi:hypothetical protein
VNIPDERRDQIKRVYHRAYDEASVTSGGGRRVLIEAGVLAVAEWARREALREAEAERDALQARLDTMTTDFRLRRTGVVNGKVAEVEPFYEQRLVGPWTVVPEGDANA